MLYHFDEYADLRGCFTDEVPGFSERWRAITRNCRFPEDGRARPAHRAGVAAAVQLRKNPDMPYDEALALVEQVLRDCLSPSLTLEKIANVSDRFCCGCDAQMFFRRYGVTERQFCPDCVPELVRTADGRRMRRQDAYFYDGAWWSQPMTVIGDYHGHPMRRSRIRQHPPLEGDKLAEDRLNLGFEFEFCTPTPRYDAERLMRLPYVVVEEDSSLPYNGIEAVTGWSTLGTTAAWAKEMYDSVEVESVVDCGFHVGISGMRQKELAKFIVFFSATAAEALVRIVAGRYDVNYASKNTWGSIPEAMSKVVDESADVGKYRHVRPRYAQGYAEVRVYRGFHEVERALAALELTWAVAKFCAEPGVDLSGRRFAQWLRDSVWTMPHTRNLRKRLEGTPYDVTPKRKEKAQCRQLSLA